MRTALCLLILNVTIPASAQFTLQTSNTTADLRGIHSIGGGVAWASGTNGTVLRNRRRRIRLAILLHPARR